MKNQAPQAEKKIFYTNYHNEKTLDPYFWLREKSNPEVIKHLKNENKYFEAKLRPYSKIKTQIFKELKNRIPKLDSGVPVRRGGKDFFYRYVEGKQYIQYCQKVGSKVDVLVDFNKIVKKDGYLRVGNVEASPDGKYLAYTYDKKGDEICELVVIETSTRKIVSNLKKTSSYFAWSTTDILYYTTLDGAIRQDRVWRHFLGQSQKKDVCIFHEPEKKFFMHIGASSSKEYLLIGSGDNVTSYVAYLPLNDKFALPSLFKPVKENVLYSIDHGADGFYIKTNEKALNAKIYKCPSDKTAPKNWKLLIAHDENVQILNFDLTKKYLCVLERSKGLPKAKIIDFEKGKTHFIKFPDAAYNMSFSVEAFNFTDNKIRISYSSPISPRTIFDYDLTTKKMVTRKVDKVKGLKSSKYEMEYVFIPGHDKTKIPMCIFYKKGLKKDGKAPAVIYGYGSYGATIGYNFSPSIISLLDRGFVYAYAGIRGGTEMGKRWYEEGKYLKKKNTFHDFISCSEYLVKKKYTAPEKLACKGGSAGGLLMGAVANMRPDLYKVVCAHVPFVDVINTMFDDSLPLTITEYTEWGNPYDKKFYKYMLSYSPYDNVRECIYPNMYITGGLNDQRVTYWEPTKWALKLRDYNEGNNDVLLKINMGEGHFGKSGRYNSLLETAEEYSYLIGKLK